MLYHSNLHLWRNKDGERGSDTILFSSHEKSLSQTATAKGCWFLSNSVLDLSLSSAP